MLITTTSEFEFNNDSVKPYLPSYLIGNSINDYCEISITYNESIFCVLLLKPLSDYKI